MKVKGFQQAKDFIDYIESKPRNYGQGLGFVKGTKSSSKRVFVRPSEEKSVNNNDKSDYSDFSDDDCSTSKRHCKLLRTNNSFYKETSKDLCKQIPTENWDRSSDDDCCICAELLRVVQAHITKVMRKTLLKLMMSLYQD